MLQTLQQICKAYERGDTAALSDLQTEAFTLTNSAGKVTTRAEDIQIATTGSVKYQAFEDRDVKVHLYGTAAVATGKTHVAGTSGNDTFEGEFQFTDMLVFLDGRWRRVASHVSRMSSDIHRSLDVPSK